MFHLHNFGYNDRRAFDDVRAIIFPSEYSRRFHASRLGLEGTVIPDPIRLDRLVAEGPDPKYVTFINPQPDKGAPVFARIAIERLWDDPAFEARHCALAKAEARRWDIERMAGQYADFFESLH